MICEASGKRKGGIIRDSVGNNGRRSDDIDG